MSNGVRKHNSNQSNDDGNLRRSRRNSGNDYDVITQMSLLLLPRDCGLVLACYDIEGLDHKCHCNGCQRWNNTSIKRKPRWEVKSAELQCFQAWKKKENQVPPSKRPHWTAMNCHLTNNLHMSAKAMTTTTNDTVKETSTTDNGVTPSPPKRKVNMVKKAIRSQGQEFTIEYPASHILFHDSHVRRWKKDSETLNAIREKLQSNMCQTDSTFAQTLWSVAMTSVPALALSAAQFVTPLIVMVHLWDTGIFKDIELAKFATSFPSDFALWQYNFSQAARLLDVRCGIRRFIWPVITGTKRGSAI